jgi:LmbE family N-acetylglucosaminyl deacetylase/ActR/RegA family two-component response regulator
MEGVMRGDQTWALVVEDDPDAAAFIRTVLERQAGMHTVVAGDAPSALRALEERLFDLIVSDIELPGQSGLDMLPQVHTLAPGIPVLVLTAHAEIDYAVDALRRDVDEFLLKPVPAATLKDRATALVEEGRRRRASAPRPRVILAVGAHPDDVEIGVGATLAAHANAGDSIVILTLSGGAVGGQASVRQAEALAAAALVGARLIHLEFEDTKLSPADGVITAIEKVVAEINPDRIYTHSVHDRHQDHRAVNQSVQVAARKVPNVACFQSPSCTVDFSPDQFVDVDEFLGTKLRMLAAYASQAQRDYMDEDLVRATARYWSRFGVGRFAEPLETIRSSVTLADTRGPGADHVNEAESAAT